MQVISRKGHAVLDYLSGILFIAAPYLFGFEHHHLARTVVVIFGLWTLVMAYITKYEGGLIKAIPMSAHLNIDMLLGILLAASPWLLNFYHEVHWPHVALGGFAVLTGIFSDRRSQIEAD
jgi:hypothetical protein